MTWKLYSDSQFESAKNKDLLLIQCCGCSQQILRSKISIKNSTENGILNLYCSSKCASKNNINRQQSTNELCSQCKKDIIVKPYAKNKSKNGRFFCSKSCSTTYNNTHKTNGYRRSKLEIWLEQTLIPLYPQLVIHFNRKDTINSELDIYIPSLKLAFELNGIFHYEPIYSALQLSQIQNNDKRKYQACLEKKIELCIIDVSKQKYHKLTHCNNVLSIVQSIIDCKLGG